ncbi:unnamed protein product [Symbiodinium pilosum]|uniref:Uncharacterized protein n=1 Tax=Symbiodinium pilosum TaxID=2952 RepID=A0A812SY02_SYMPI|nr:unnamed protein product [Symbiodinium pilosum]
MGQAMEPEAMEAMPPSRHLQAVEVAVVAVAEAKPPLLAVPMGVVTVVLMVVLVAAALVASKISEPTVKLQAAELVEPVEEHTELQAHMVAMVLFLVSARMQQQPQATAHTELRRVR